MSSSDNASAVGSSAPYSTSAPDTTHASTHASTPAPTRESAVKRIAVVGAGPVGLALALLLVERTTQTQVTVFDARPADKDMSGDGRTLAMSLGSVQLLERLRAWDESACEPIRQVHVSQAPPTFEWPSFLPPLAGDAASVSFRASELGGERLGAVMSYGGVVTPLQRRWFQTVQAQPQRAAACFGVAVQRIEGRADGRVDVDLGDAPAARVGDETQPPFDLAVVAEGGVFATQARKAITHDYHQTAWVGTLLLDSPPGDERSQGLAIERFTRHGPAAMLPLPPRDGVARAALVWCVPSDEDPFKDLDDTQRVAVLNTIFPRGVAPSIRALAAPLKAFPLGLNAERSLVDATAAIVRIGNAAQTLHPVAGQGLNLGLRDAYALADALRLMRPTDSLRDALRRVEWQRAPDRLALIAGTDFLARSFTWPWPGFGAARGAALALLDRAGPIKRQLARQMMFGSR